MFIQGNRYTTKSGIKRMSYSLVELRYVDGRPRKRTLLNLGQEFSLPREDWSKLTTLVRENFDGQSSVELEANSSPIASVARQIIRRLHAAGYRAELAENPYESIVVQRIEYPPNANRSVGAERLCLRAIERLNLEGSLTKLGYSPPSIRLAKVCIIAKMVKPGSRPIVDWVQKDSSLLELLDMEAHPVTLAKLRRVAGKLWPVRGQVLRGMNLNGLLPGEDVTSRRCRDLTYVEDATENAAMIIVLLSGHDALRSCKVLRNPNHFLHSVKRIKSSNDILVIRSDQVTEQLLHRWTKCGIKWLCINFDDPAAREPLGSANYELVHFASELRLYANSLQDQPNELVEEDCRRFERALTELEANLTVPFRPSKYRTVKKHIGALRDQYSCGSDLYDIHLSRGKADKVVGISFKRVGKSQPGSSSYRYVLRTNLMDWDRDQLTRHFKQLTENRRIIRALDDRTIQMSDHGHERLDLKKANWAVMLLAFMVVQSIERTLRDNGIELDWMTLRRKLARWQRITSILTSSDADIYLERQDTRIDSELGRIAAALGVKPVRHLKRSKYRF